MGKFLLSTLLLLITAFASTAETVYELNLDKTATRESCNAYNKSWKLTKDSQKWTINGFSNNNNAWDYIAGGTKTAANVLDYIYIASDFAIESNIDEVVITGYKKYSSTKDHWISCKLQTSNNSNFTDLVNDIDIQESSFTTTSGDVKVKLATPVAGQYVRLYLSMQQSTNNGWLALSKITINGTNSTEPIMPTECAAPVYAIDGKNMIATAGNAYAGSIISVSCPTSGSTVSWAVTVNNGEQTTIEGDAPTYTIPESAQIGDVYAFTATASVEGEIDGIAQTLTKSSTLEVTIAEKKGTRTNPYSVADIIAGSNNLGNGIWVKGFIVGSMVNNNFATTGHVNTNLVLSANIDDHTNIVPVELPSGQVRTGLNIKDHSEYINEEVLIYGNSKAYFGKTGIKGTSAYKLLHIAPAVPQLDESVTVSENNTISGTGTVIVKFTGLDEFTNIYYTLEPKSTTQEVEAYSVEGHNHSELLYDKENGIPLNSTHVGSTLKAFACDSETGLDSTPVEYAIDITTGVAEIEAAGTGEVRWFDMQGREVKGQPEKGIYVRVVNGKASKVIL